MALFAHPYLLYRRDGEFCSRSYELFALFYSVIESAAFNLQKRYDSIEIQRGYYNREVYDTINDICEGLYYEVVSYKPIYAFEVKIGKKSYYFDLNEISESDIERFKGSKTLQNRYNLYKKFFRRKEDYFVICSVKFKVRNR